MDLMVLKLVDLLHTRSLVSRWTALIGESQALLLIQETVSSAVRCCTDLLLCFLIISNHHSDAVNNKTNSGVDSFFASLSI